MLTLTIVFSNSVKVYAVDTIVSSGLNTPIGVAVDSTGNVYISDPSNNAIKKWDKGTGINYAVGDKLVIGSSNVTLYTRWMKKYIPENVKYVLIGDYAYNIKALFDASKKAEIMNAINSQNGNKIYYKINGKILSINGSLTNDDKTYLKGLKVNYEGDSDFSVPENDIE